MVNGGVARIACFVVLYNSMLLVAELCSMSRSALRDSIIRAVREINALGINQGTAGNISVRDGDAMLITPSGIPYTAMTPEMIAIVSLVESDLVFEGLLSLPQNGASIATSYVREGM